MSLSVYKFDLFYENKLLEKKFRVFDKKGVSVVLL